MVAYSFSPKPRRALLTWLVRVALVFCVVAAGTAPAQDYPARAIRFLLPFGPGGVADIQARVLAQAMGESMHQQVVVENRPSAGYIVATEAAMKAEPNGYTMLWLGSGQAVSVSLFKSLPYDLVRDLAPVSTVGFYGLALLVNADSPLKSVADLIALAKANPAKFNVGVTNIGGSQHLTAEVFKSMAGLETQIVPYKTTPAVIGAVRGNEVQAIFEFLTPALPHIKNGALRAFGVTTERRYPGLPDVPTLAEAGIPGYEASTWGAVAMPANTPRAIIDRMNRELNAALAIPTVKQRLQDLGIDPRGSTPEGLRELLIADIAKWKAVVEKAKIARQ